MKAVIPAAGRGTRLYPQTHTKPKAMIRLAGRPILGHILTTLAKTRIDEVVVIVGGSMQNQIVEYTQQEFSDRFTFYYPKQERPEGLGHSIYQARPIVTDEPILIALGDMLFESGYETFLDTHSTLDDVDGSIGVKRVEEPRHYGVVDVQDENRVNGLVEKPDNPSSDWAISGVYIIENTTRLFDALEFLIGNKRRGAGDEYQLTDALQLMVERDAELGVFEVTDWYDCGRPETLLEANRVLLSKYDNDQSANLKDTVIVPPVDIGESVSIEAAIVGPNVSIDDDTTLSNSIVENSIIGCHAHLEDLNISASIVGDEVYVTSQAREFNIGDNSELTL